MKFLKKYDADRIILVISDLHLGAGSFVNGKKNFLEDFHSDQELVDFLNYYSQGEYSSREVELIINGDFIDFLAIPFVNYFDDEFWSEQAGLEKLELAYQAHQEVFQALNNFLDSKNKKLTYIIGNHDAEFILSELQTRFLSYFSENLKPKITFLNSDTIYHPIPECAIMHGHEYEKAHFFDPQKSILKTAEGIRYLIPPWGSYYVTRVINKYKEEREFINQIRPIKTFLIYGLIFDTLFTLRFIFSNAYYFLMVRLLYFLRVKGNWKELSAKIREDIELFKNYESLTREFFELHPKVKTLIVGHTHEPTYKNYADGSLFINTGTWTKMINLDFSRRQDNALLTYAKILIPKEKKKNVRPQYLLNVWKGRTDLPYEEL